MALTTVNPIVVGVIQVLFSGMLTLLKTSFYSKVTNILFVRKPTTNISKLAGF